MPQRTQRIAELEAWWSTSGFASPSASSSAFTPCSPQLFSRKLPWKFSQPLRRLPRLLSSHLNLVVTTFVCLSVVPTAHLALLPFSRFSSLVHSTSHKTAAKKKNKPTTTKPVQPQYSNKAQTIQHCTRSCSPSSDLHVHLFSPRGVYSSLESCFDLISSKRQKHLSSEKNCLIWRQTFVCRAIFIKQCKGCNVPLELKVC